MSRGILMFTMLVWLIAVGVIVYNAFMLFSELLSHAH